MKFRNILCIALALVLLFLLPGCGQESPQTTEADGMTCTLEIRCDTLLENLDEMEPEKAALVPDSGILLEKTQASFQTGESVFDVFRRVLREEKLHFEYVDASAYNSV